MFTYDEMQKPKFMKKPCEERTLDSLHEDLVHFQQNGSFISKAKEFNKVIDDVYFNLPLDQVILLTISVNKERRTLYSNIIQNRFLS